MNEYPVQSHVVLEGFNTTKNDWVQVKQCPSGIDGPFEWHRYVCHFSPEPSISKLRLILNAGVTSEAGKEAITYFDGIYVIPLPNDATVIPEWVFKLDIVIPILGFSSLILYKKNRYVIALSFISLLGLFLLKGTNPPFSNVFEFLFIHGLYVFREVWHFAFLYGFALSFLIGFLYRQNYYVFSIIFENETNNRAIHKS